MRIFVTVLALWPLVGFGDEPVYLDCRLDSDPETVAFELTIDAGNDKVTYTDALNTIKTEALFTADNIRFSFTHRMAGDIMNKQDFEIDRASLEYKSVSIVHLAGKLEDVPAADAIHANGRCEIQQNADRKI